jgi:hypothetical protein
LPLSFDPRSPQEVAMTGRNAFYAQSGGVTAVINASACGVLQTARHNLGEIGKVYTAWRWSSARASPNISTL